MIESRTWAAEPTCGMNNNSSMNEWDVKVGKENNVGAQHAECPCALGQKVPYDRGARYMNEAVQCQGLL